MKVKVQNTFPTELTFGRVRLPHGSCEVVKAYLDDAIELTRLGEFIADGTVKVSALPVPTGTKVAEVEKPKAAPVPVPEDPKDEPTNNDTPMERPTKHWSVAKLREAAEALGVEAPDDLKSRQSKKDLVALLHARMDLD